LPLDDTHHHPTHLDFAIGQTYHRQNDIHKKFGGSEQAGIVTCSQYPHIFLFKTPTGKDAGYEDGWVDEDTYFYTGQGQKGDMRFVRGNKAILNHQADDKRLYLFQRIKSGRYEYLGEFRYEDHKFVDGFDFKHRSRKIIRFTLKKVAGSVR